MGTNTKLLDLIMHTAKGLAACKRGLVFILLLVIAQPALSGSSACPESGCSAGASVHFTVIIPETIGLRAGSIEAFEAGSVNTTRGREAANLGGYHAYNNTRSNVSYAWNGNGTVTLALP